MQETHEYQAVRRQPPKGPPNLICRRRAGEHDQHRSRPASGQARGFAFVEMSDVEGARRAISELDRHELGGRSLTVNEAKPMAARPSGGGGGFGRQRREARW